MSSEELMQSWDRRYRSAALEMPQAAEVLAQNRHLLPREGSALDIACGLGNNALLLAQLGLDTSAWDSSAEAIKKLRAIARERGLALRAEVRDVQAQPPEPATFDVITVSRFLIRALAEPLMAALRPDGLLFYQTFSKIKVNDSGPSNPDFLLDDNELLRLFAPLRVRVYREEGRCGDLGLGLRNSALLIAQKQG